MVYFTPTALLNVGFTLFYKDDSPTSLIYTQYCSLANSTKSVKEPISFICEIGKIRHYSQRTVFIECQYLMIFETNFPKYIKEEKSKI